MMHRHLAFAAVAALLSACADSIAPGEPAGVEIDPPTVTMETGDTIRVHAYVVDDAGQRYLVPPAGFEITWSTSTPTVATVSNGLIEAVRHGQAVITAEAGDLPVGQVQVTVEPRTVQSRLEFGYSGDRSGTFVVDVNFPADEIDWDGSWAWSWLFDQGPEDFQILEAQRLRGDGRLDYFWLWVAGAVDSPGVRDIVGAEFILGYDVATGASVADYWEVRTQFGPPGQVSFATVDDRRMAGTFGLDMESVECNEDRTFCDYDGNALLSITTGSFDLSVLTMQEVAGEMAAQLPTMPASSAVAPRRPGPPHR